MKIVVFGGTRGTGKEVVQQALGAGHSVTVLARNPAAVSIRHDQLEVVRGDVFDSAAVSQAIARGEIVVSTLGVSDDSPTTLFSQGVANMIQAMRAAHVNRLLCLSANGLDPGPLWQRWIARPLLWRVFGNSYADLVRMEDVVKNSPLDWTILRPPRLTNGPHTGKYAIGVNRHLSHGWRISRADVADFILGQICNPAMYRAVVELAW